MIDWLTLRHPLTPALGDVVYKRILESLGRIVCMSPTGEKLWEKASPDWESIRSDTPGLMWSVTGNADGERMLTIGASPAALEHGNNVFGGDDVRHAANVLVRFAASCLGAVLPPVDRWQCRRIDITHNYDMGGPREVKQALRHLMGTDSARRKATTSKNGGDSIYWSPSSDLSSGKAYHKGPHLRFLDRKGRDLRLDESHISACDRLLRFELKLGSRWFRRIEENKIKGAPSSWLDFTPEFLNAQHEAFFSRFIGTVEVTDMSNLLTILEDIAPTAGAALAAHRTWAVIRAVGYESAKASMPPTTWFRHTALLRKAGLSDSDLCASNVIPLRRQQLVLRSPVNNWADLRLAA